MQQQPGLDSDRFDDYVQQFVWSARRAIFEETQAELQRLLDSWRWSHR